MPMISHMEADNNLNQDANQRKYIRHPAEIPIKYKLAGERKQRTDTAKNISVGGLCFQASSFIEPGTKITLKFPTVRPEVELLGTVVWCLEKKDEVDVGVEFVDENEAGRARIIEEICYSKKYETYFE
jgi:hypothetical protein